VVIVAGIALMVGAGLAVSRREGATPPAKSDLGVKLARKPRAPGPLRLAVVQFKNLGDEKDLSYLTEGIGDTIATKLGEIEGLKLIERNQITQAMKEIDFGKGEYADKETATELGRLTGAEVVVLGGYQRASGQLRASARFVSTETGEVLAARVVTKPADAPFDVQDAIAAEVRAGAIGLAQGK
jgi:TolB-like protein